MGSMERLRFIPILLALTTSVAVCAPIEPQSSREDSAGQPKVKQIREVERPMPFSPGAVGNTHSIEFRTVDQMTEKDRDLEADAESLISERAGFAGLEFNGGKWSYQQVVCPALPNHIFLRFTRNNGVGDVSVFSASIPRNVEGRVRIIPILLRGYSLFSPAPINKLTISAFNHIRAEEDVDRVSDWLGTGLCYAALAGGHPQAALLTEAPDGQNFAAAMPTMLEIPVQGGAVIRFMDLGATRRPVEWAMTFDGKGRLLKATHSPVGLPVANSTLPNPVDFHSKPLHETAADLKVREVPPYYDLALAAIPAP